jgi:radical SAM superfamily enzyme YgiQ (UPF0313 family)
MAHHYCDFGETAGYLDRLPGIALDVIDAGVLNYSIGDIIQEMKKNYDVLVIKNHFENLYGFAEIVKMAKLVNPKIKIITYGPVSNVIPRFFTGFDIAAIVSSGDYEPAIEKFLVYTRTGDPAKLNGLFYKDKNGWNETPRGEIIDPKRWGLPLMEKLPLNAYRRITEGFQLNTIGIKGMKELGLTISKGCPYGCAYCMVPKTHGYKDRRRDIKQALDFLQKYMPDYDYLTIHSPTFTLDKEYVRNFCNEILKRKFKFKWKCVTTVRDSDPELFELMAKAGCFRVSFGIETLELESQKVFRKVTTADELKKVVEWCKKAGMEAACFIMIGMPKQTKKGIKETLAFVRKIGAKARVSAYTPFQDLAPDATIEDIIQMDKRTYYTGKDTLSKEEFNELIFNA